MKIMMIMLMAMFEDVFSLMKMNILIKLMLLTLEVLIGEKMMILQVFHVLKKEKQEILGLIQRKCEYKKKIV